ncbi:MAG: site-specific tyrosine recombinase/integron integrase [Dehalococcoidia bacterium]
MEFILYRQYAMRMKNKNIEHIVEQYFDYLSVQKNLSESSISTYSDDMNSLINFLNENRIYDVRHVDRKKIRSYLVWLSEQKFDRSSISRKLSVLRTFFRWLLNENLINENPVPSRISIKKDRKLPRFLSIDEVNRLCEIPSVSHGISEHIVFRDRAIIELFYSTGIRVSEMSRLNLTDVDFSSKSLKVIGKGDKERVVYFADSSSRSLKEYLNKGRSTLSRKNDSDRMAFFLSDRGNRISVRSIQARIKKYTKMSGLDSKVHVHTLRHTFATHLLNGGADLRVVQDLMGHSSPYTTQIYTHVTALEARKSYFSAHPLSGKVK